MSGTINTNAELIREMEHGGELIPPAPIGKTTYTLARQGHLLRNVRRSVAESVLNDTRYRHVNARGTYIYQEP